MTASSSKNVVKPIPTPSSLLSDQAQDIPIFLRKTYHMVDTCDPSVACWSEDGETFVVKDPVKFEQQIIPQFFKHSKFSSFVRQLNFYAFRKIKYADTIRIDPKLEAETANYWRFRHEKFQRGKPELLADIKRMNGQKQAAQNQKKTTSPVPSGGGGAAEKENSVLKSEVNQLKSKLEQMTKNIDELTSLVQKVSLQQQAPPPAPSTTMNSNNKRTKVSEDAMPPLPDIPLSFNRMELDESFPQPPSIPSPFTQDRAMSNTSEISDDTFVDQLFTAFKTENFDFAEDSSVKSSPPQQKANKPRPELMNRLSEALEVLPPSIQELIVDRLIQAITAPKEIQESLASSGEQQIVPESVPQSPITKELTSNKDSPNLPLAAATLAALLSQYGEDAVKAAAASAATKDAHKALLIPVHA